MGDYSIVISEGNYTAQITPPSGSGYSSAINYNISISSNLTLNISLTPAGTATISGYLYDPNGSPLANQGIILSGNGQVSTTTNNSGFYSLQVANGTYTLILTADLNQGINAPSYYFITKSNFQINQSMSNFNLTLPAKKVTVHTESSTATSIPNTVVTTSQNTYPSLALNSIITDASGYSYYDSSSQATTNNSGNVDLWLFPSTSSTKYTVTATPPSNSNYGFVSVNNVNVTENTNKTIVLPNKVTLTGHLYDPTGVPLANQQIILTGNGQVSTTTDNTGFYSLSTAAGTYSLIITADETQGIKAPSYYFISKSGLALTQNTTNYDLTLPAKKVSIRVQDAAGAGIQNVTLTTNQTTYPNLVLSSNVTGANGYSYYQSSSGAVTNQSGDVDLWLFPSTSTTKYIITATPPTGSTYSANSLQNVNITDNTSRTITLSKPVTISGRVLDSTGTPLANQGVILSGNGQVSTTTNSNGFYSLQVMTGTYTLFLTADANTGINAPSYYFISKSGFSVTQNLSNFDFTLPAKKVSVHVQNAFGNSIQNVTVTTNQTTYPNLILNSSITDANGYSYYENASQAITNSNGNVDLWLFPSTSNTKYILAFTPPSGSIYSPFTSSNVNVVNNQTELVSLQYNHNSPLTNINLQTQYSDQTYSDPTTVSLSASAAAGYTVVNTYYTIDGGSQQTYTSPFTVNGNGNHTVTYWSVDNSGVLESVKTKSFSISARYNLTGIVYVDSNQNGFQDNSEGGYSGAVLNLSTGQSVITGSNGSYTITNLEYGSYQLTLSLPNNYSATTSNPVNVAINANTTQNFGISSGPVRVTGINTGGNTSGDFTSDNGYSGGSLYSTTETVDTTAVTSPAPQDVYKTVRYGNFTYTIDNLTPNGSYGIKLHFNELYWNSIGARVFDVKYNGQTVLDNYDIYESAGGKNKAIIAEVNGTADGNGTITLQFITEFDNAMVNGIEVYSGNLDIPTPTPTTALTVPYGINTGGSNVSDFKGDRNFSGGSLYTTTNSVDITGVTNAAPESVYKSVRYGNFSYSLPNLSANTNYILRLHFNEFYWSSIGSRVFDVSVNGSQVLNDYDIYEAAGSQNKAIIEDIPVTTNSSGNLTVQFTSVIDNAMVSGIEVLSN